MEKYSQNDEQRYILDYFNDPKKVVFVDIGAFDGRSLSNTYALSLLGASGVCVEPSPSIFPLLEETYKDNNKVKLFQAAISDKNGQADFYDSNDYYSSLLQSETKQWLKDGITFTKKTVKTLTVDTLLYLADINRVDFLSIDAEGLDFKILKQFDLEKLNVKMICIECPHNREAVKIYLNDYKVIYECSENIIAVK